MEFPPKEKKSYSAMIVRLHTGRKIGIPVSDIHSSLTYIHDIHNVYACTKLFQPLVPIVVTDSV